MTNIQATVLVADARAHNRKLIAGTLQGHYKIFEADCGEAVLSVLAERAVHVILLDVKLPDVSSIELTALLKDMGPTRDVPIIVVTTLEDRDTRLAALRAGAEDFLSRPFDQNELLTRVRNLARLKLLSDENRGRNTQLQWRLERFFSVSLDLFCIAGSDGYFKDLNPAWVETLGFSRTELKATPFINFVHPDDRERTVAENAMLRAQRSTTVNISNRYRCATGEYKWLQWSATFDAEQDLIIASARDISAQVASQENLLEERRRFRQLAEATSEGLIFLTASGRIVDTNDQALSLLNLPNLSQAKSLSEFISHEDWDSLQARLNENDATPYETKVTTYSGNSVVAAIELHPIGGSSKRGSGDPEFVVSIRDISIRKNLEKQLRHSQKLDAIGKLAGGIAHDFNNLLTVIISYCSFVRSDLPPGDTKISDLDEVLTATDNAVSLTRQLLLFSREQPMDLQVVDVAASLASIELLLARTIGEDVRLTVRVPSQPLTVLADPMQVDQIILNLALNARDAMIAGGALQIQASSVDIANPADAASLVAGRFIRIEVADTGVGMDDETQSRIFEPFFTTKGQAEGAGLGLATCYGIVTQLGGAIDVDSELGKGTTFTVHLPAFDGPPLRDTSTKLSPSDLLGDETILVVEDEPVIREIAERTLRSCGYTVLVAEDGIRGLEVFLANKDSIDMLFSDVILPRGNGFELADEVRRRKSDIKILLTSGYAERKKVRANPGFPIYWKPYSPAQLARRIRECLDQRALSTRGNNASTAPATEVRLLVVDDDEPVRIALCRILEDEGYVVESFSTISDAQGRLERFRNFDGVLCDLNVNGQSGLELLSWTEVAAPQLAEVFFIVTGAASAEAAKAHAHRLILKPFNVVELLSRLATLTDRKQS